MFESDINLLEMLTMFGTCLNLVGQGSSVAPAPKLMLTNTIQVLDSEKITSSHY